MTGPELAGAVVLALGVLIGLAVAPSVGSTLADRRAAEAAWQQHVAAVATAPTPWWFVGRRARLVLDVGAVLLVIGVTVAFAARAVGAVLGGAAATIGLLLIVVSELSRHWPAGRRVPNNSSLR